MGRKVYADNAATTAVSPQVLEAMLPFYKEVYGNPSSLYGLGQEAKAKLEQARDSSQMPGRKAQRDFLHKLRHRKRQLGHQRLRKGPA